jgi:hypothetical protein
MQSGAWRLPVSCCRSWALLGLGLSLSLIRARSTGQVEAR